jgi:hypothetical protein
VYAVGAGNNFFIRLAENIVNGKDLPTTRILLDEHGISDHKGFAQWLLSQPTRTPGLSALFDQDGKETLIGAQYMTAIQRFVDSTIQNPDPATRPQLAANPYLRLVYGITAFSYSFYENAMKRIPKLLWSIGKQDGAGRAGEELARVSASIAALYGAQFIATFVREMLLNADKYEDMDDDEILAQLAMVNLSRTLAFGPWEYLIQSFGQIKYARPLNEAALGPAITVASGGLQKVLEVFSDRNSPNTTTTERRAAEAVYGGAIQPAINAGLAAVPLNAMWYKLAAGGAIVFGGDAGRSPFADMFGERPERMNPGDREYEEVMREFREVEDQIKGRMASLPVETWEAELEAIKAEFPGMLDDVELDTYANNSQNRRQGRAGQPKVSPNGLPQLRPRGDRDGASLFGDIRGYQRFRREGGRNVPYTTSGMADQVSELNAKIREIREEGDMSVVRLREIAPGEETTRGLSGDLSRPATREEIQETIRLLTTQRREAQRRAVERVREARGE